MSEIRTCAESLIFEHLCCEPTCVALADIAIIDAGLVEHARCDKHIADAVATKPLHWDGIWGMSC